MPKKFLEKIIQDLIRCGLIKSKRGARGGYSIARSPERISFSDVIAALEGPIAVNTWDAANKSSGDSNKQFQSTRRNRQSFALATSDLDPLAAISKSSDGSATV